uniref:leucine-rich repeat and immunoglobulin-like domain-containing nogo receptor-interacting protein 2 n=1 Tax=Styela clava TaxID=7725 RepID=UPI0019392834|nr:leucine-rich repeat and immunoglobulin-like domain-containing nogo receptor-interacting protein 2 [Styela clava]
MLENRAGRMIFCYFMLVFEYTISCPDTPTCVCERATMSVTCSRTPNLQYKLPVGIPSDTRSLTINISTLKKIGPTAFRTTRVLSEVDLSSNKIETIAETSFQSLSRLQSLRLDNNRLKLIPEHAFSQSNQLRRLHLSGNKILVLIPMNFHGLDNLDELYLLRNPTMCIALDAFAGLPRLRKLEMSGMNASLDSSMFHTLPNLRILVIRNFLRVKSIPEDLLWKNEKLEKLYLEHIQLADGISPNLLNMSTKLRVISLRGCGLTSVPVDALEHVKDSLRELDLSHNRLKTISINDFKNLQGLRVLNLRKTGLTYIPSNALALPHLASLDLSGNMLSTLQKSALGSKLKNVSFGNNPWICDCGLKWLAEAHYYHEPSIPVICAEPQAMQGFEIRFLPRPVPKGEYFQCEVPKIKKIGLDPKGSQTLLVDKNKPISFDVTCIASGYPRPLVSWIILSRDAKPATRKRSLPENIATHVFDQNTRLKRSMDSESKQMCTVCEVGSQHTENNIWVSLNGTLHVRDLVGTDATGIYTCQAANSQGIRRDSIVLEEHTEETLKLQDKTKLPEPSGFTASNKGMVIGTPFPLDMEDDFGGMAFGEDDYTYYSNWRGENIQTHSSWRTIDNPNSYQQPEVQPYGDYRHSDVGNPLPLMAPSRPREKTVKREVPLSPEIKYCRTQRCSVRNVEQKVEAALGEEYLRDAEAGNGINSPYLELSPGADLADTLTRSQTSCCGDNSANGLHLPALLMTLCSLAFSILYSDIVL